MKTLILILLLLLPSVYGEGYKLQYRQIFAGIDKDSYWGQYNQLNFAKEKYFSLSESVSLDIEAQSILNQGDLIFLQNSSGILNQGNTTYFPLNLNLSEGDNHRLDFNLSKLKFQIQREMWGLNFGRFNVNWGSHLFFFTQRMVEHP